MEQRKPTDRANARGAEMAEDDAVADRAPWKTREDPLTLAPLSKTPAAMTTGDRVAKGTGVWPTTQSLSQEAATTPTGVTPVSAESTPTRHALTTPADETEGFADAKSRAGVKTTTRRVREVRSQAMPDRHR